jgi:hypothetical protein
VPKSVVAKSLAEELMVFRERLRFAKTWDISITHDGGYRLTRPGRTPVVILKWGLLGRVSPWSHSSKGPLVVLYGNPPPVVYAYPPAAYSYQPVPPAYAYSPPAYGEAPPPAASPSAEEGNYPPPDGDYPTADGEYDEYPASGY